MRILTPFYIFLLAIPFVYTSAAQDSPGLHPVGKWINEDRSRLEIDSYDPESGRISGTYYSSGGTDGKGYPLLGWFNPNTGTERNNSPVISFTVHWGEMGSLTSWTGYLYRHEGQITMYTLWHLVRASETYSWERLLTRSSTFVLMR